MGYWTPTFTTFSSKCLKIYGVWHGYQENSKYNQNDWLYKSAFLNSIFLKPSLSKRTQKENERNTVERKKSQGIATLSLRRTSFHTPSIRHFDESSKSKQLKISESNTTPQFNHTFIFRNIFHANILLIHSTIKSPPAKTHTDFKND